MRYPLATALDIKCREQGAGLGSRFTPACAQYPDVHVAWPKKCTRHRRFIIGGGRCLAYSNFYT